jgi:hypothetical protein
VKLYFLGTRGEIEARSRRHRRHSVLHVSHGGRALLVATGSARRYDGRGVPGRAFAARAGGRLPNRRRQERDLLRAGPRCRGGTGRRLRGLDLYVGDGAAIGRSIVRYREGKPIGHASIRAQLAWCARTGLGRAIFTHCGSEIVRDERRAAERVAALGAECGVQASIAQDGPELDVRAIGRGRFPDAHPRQRGDDRR